MKKTLAIVVCLLMAGPAMADFSTGNWTNVNSYHAHGDVLNTIMTYDYTGTDFMIGTFDVVGDGEAFGGSWASEARIWITAPTGENAGFQLSTQNSDGLFDVNGWSDYFNGVQALGQWSFEFYESYDDGTPDPDATWYNIQLDFNDDWAPPPSLADYVDHAYAGNFTHSGNNGTYANDTNGGTGDPFYAGSETGGDIIYELDWAGGDMFLELLFSNADGDIDLFLYDNPTPSSPVDYGYSGSDNEYAEYLAAPAGTYYIRVDGYNEAANDFVLNVTPEPTTLALLAFGGLALIRRRR